jgi:hypothetical protein
MVVQLHKPGTGADIGVRIKIGNAHKEVKSGANCRKPPGLTS